MITINVGRTFLNAFNKHYEKEYTAKEFFEKEFFELFFNHPKYMLWPTNSPFVQMKKGQKPELLSVEERNEKLQNLYSKIAEGSRDASIAIGFPASEEKEFATTSGLVTDLLFDSSDDDIYFSWLGSGLCIGVAGGLAIFFDKEEILIKLYEGWKVYRKFLNDPSLERLAGNKITSWNGQWLNYVYSNDYREHFDFATLENLGFFQLSVSETAIETVKWSRLFFNLSQHFSGQTFMGYVFSFGQMNKTMGFYPFRFQHANRIITFYKTLFGENAALQDRTHYESLFGLHIKRACEMGSFGMQALEPEGLAKYFSRDRFPNLEKSKVIRKANQSDEEYMLAVREAEENDYKNKIIPFRTYKTWLLAMITKNNEEMSDYTQDIAKAMYGYACADKAGSKKRSNIVEKELLAARSKRLFLEALTEIIMDVNEESLETFKGLRDRVHLMTNEDFGYFVVLLKFDYAYQQRIS